MGSKVWIWKQQAEENIGTKTHSRYGRENRANSERVSGYGRMIHDRETQSRRKKEEKGAGKKKQHSSRKGDGRIEMDGKAALVSWWNKHVRNKKGEKAESGIILV